MSGSKKINKTRCITIDLGLIEIDTFGCSESEMIDTLKDKWKDSTYGWQMDLKKIIIKELREKT